ncbi:MAG: creatininase family protein [Bacteroidota bacterium]
MRPYILAETNWKYIQSHKFDLAVLPWGATEAHNYHLPYATDVIEGDHIAAESAKIAWEKGAKVVVLPTIPFGVNTGQKDIYLDINIYPSTQFAILKDIAEVLNTHGIKKLMIMNSHGGNDWKSIVRELGSLYPEMFICVTDWFKSLDRTKYFDDPGDHADEMETSLVMHLRPDLVLPRSEWGDGKEKKNKIKSFSEGWAWAERRWSQVTNDTGIGNPMAASAEKGKAFFDAVCEKMSGLFIELCNMDIDNIYE